MEIIDGTKYRARLTKKGTSSYLLVPVKARSFLGLADGCVVEVRYARTDGQPATMILLKAADQ